MVCYTIPTIAAVVHHFLGNKIPSWRNQQHRSLSLLLVGGAIFGVVDHLWNGELLLIGENIVSDLLLGFAITAAIIVAWIVVLQLEKMPRKETSKVTN
ncbi:MAG: hypothetical protein QXF56_02315 [Candidatus Micrarchaeia archaeon]